MVRSSWVHGWRRVFAAPWVVGGVFVLTFVLAVPLALTMRGMLQAQVGRSLAARDTAGTVNYDWWQEFTSQASGIGSSFRPAIIGFAATLENIGSVADGQREVPIVTGVLALYLLAWTFVSGGIIDRYARRRSTRAHGFFAACGVYFVRFLRLALVAGLFYWWAFAVVHEWLFDDRYPELVRNVSVERNAFAVRAALYAAFGALLAAGNLLFDYARIRAVVEDRRSMIGALTAGARFAALQPALAFGLYAVNTLMFLALLGLWSTIAPGAGGSGAGLWAGLVAGQLFLAARLLLKLHFLASQTALFQASLAHAAYTAAPAPAWPESPAAESIRP